MRQLRYMLRPTSYQVVNNLESQRRLQPLGIEAALGAMNAHAEEHLAQRRQLENSLEQARFEASRAHRQYDQVDPDNRLVAGELERRWNDRLATTLALALSQARERSLPSVSRRSRSFKPSVIEGPVSC
jgi:hypothetical protein